LRHWEYGVLVLLVLILLVTHFSIVMQFTSY
ncbi:unnamed protein product, partial [marine sediment metagenome]